MNNGFTNQSGFPGTPLYVQGNPVPNQQVQNNLQSTQFEQSYIENILRLNKGKLVKDTTAERLSELSPDNNLETAFRRITNKNK